MGQIFRQDTIKTPIKVSGTQIQMPAGNFITVGGQQYRNANAVTVTLSSTGFNGLDTGALAANKLYAIHAVVQSGVLGFTASLSELLPTGFSSSKIVGYFDTNNSSVAQTVGSDKGHGKVGDVKHSVLTEAQFQTENGPGWILADSRSITGSRLHTLQGFATAHDARGRALIGAGQGSGLSNRTLGETPGAESHTLSTNEMPAHKHGTNTTGPNGDASASRFGSYTGSGGQGGQFTGFGTYSAPATSTDGGGAAHNNMQPSLAVNIFVKVN